MVVQQRIVQFLQQGIDQFFKLMKVHHEAHPVEMLSAEVDSNEPTVMMHLFL